MENTSSQNVNVLICCVEDVLWFLDQPGSLAQSYKKVQMSVSRDGD